MSDNNEGFFESYMNKLPDSIQYWMGLPDPKENHDDNIWHHFHVFDDEWVDVQNRMEWYDSPNVPSIYTDHKYIFKQNMGMGKPEETYYEQNIDSGDFKTSMEVTESLPSGIGGGEMKIEVEINTLNPPSGENNFCLVAYTVDTKVKYDVTQGVRFLPRFLANPLNRFFKWAFMQYIAEDMVDRDGEYAIERTTEYFQYLRKYHGEEPTQTKSRQTEFTPLPEDGVFFQ